MQMLLMISDLMKEQYKISGAERLVGRKLLTGTGGSYSTFL